MIYEKFLTVPKVKTLQRSNEGLLGEFRKYWLFEAYLPKKPKMFNI